MFEICGKGHGSMPIEIKVVSKEDFAGLDQESGAMPDGASDSPAVSASEVHADEVVPQDLPVPVTVKNKL